MKIHLLPVLCHFQCVLRGKPHKLFSFFSYRVHRVESFMTIGQFWAKQLILAQLLHRGSHLIIIFNDHCHRLDYMGITDMETILCNIYLVLSKFLCEKMGVRHTPFINEVFPACYISSTKDLCHVNINLLETLMQFLLDFHKLNFHRCGFLIHLETNITFWLTHLRRCMKIRGLLK